MSSTPTIYPTVKKTDATLSSQGLEYHLHPACVLASPPYSAYKGTLTCFINRFYQALSPYGLFLLSFSSHPQCSNYSILIFIFNQNLFLFQHHFPITCPPKKIKNKKKTQYCLQPIIPISIFETLMIFSNSEQ